MFGWFSTRCPLPTYEKTWTEYRMCWLARELGIDRLKAAEVILPTEQHFPDAYEGSDADARRMLDRLCGYMGIGRGIRLRVCPDEAIPDAAGTYQRDPQTGRALIRVAASQLDDPAALAATLAHELAHEILLGGGLLDESLSDHELITDLVPAYLGLGVFTANATLREQYEDDGNMSWWTIGRQGYLPSRVLGYALALFCLARGETSPSWLKYLRTDAASALKNGLRYVEKTGDCLFRPDTWAGQWRPTAEQAVRTLHEGTASARLAALWDIQDYDLTTPDCLDAVVRRVDDADPAVAAAAACALPMFGPAAEKAVAQLLYCLQGDSDEVKAGAAFALGELGAQKQAVAQELSLLLMETNRDVVQAGVTALARLGVPLDPRSSARLLGHLEAALVECDEAFAEALVDALLDLAEEPDRLIEHSLGNADRDLCREALRVLGERRMARGKEQG